MTKKVRIEKVVIFKRFERFWHWTIQALRALLALDTGSTDHRVATVWL